MAMVFRLHWACLLLGFVALIFGTTFNTVQAEPIGWIETFALADDRESVLSELIPGSDDYYFYHCLHHQTSGQLESAEAVLAKWLAEKKGQATPAITAMTDRQRLLTYRQSPQRTIEYLTRRLGVRLDHAAPLAPNQRKHPSVLDPKVLDADALIRDAIHHNQSLTPAALSHLAKQFRTGQQAQARITLSAFLNLIHTPSIPDLGQLVIQELNQRPAKAKRFGDRSAHSHLTLDELRQIAADVPAIANDQAIVHAILLRLRPDDDTDLSNDRDQRWAYLKRVDQYVQTLSPSHHSLKAAAAFRLLEANLAHDVFDRELLLRYLQLPRHSSIIHPVWRDRKGHPATLNQDFMDVALLPPIGDEQSVVRTHLEHFLESADSTQAFDAYLKPEYLRQVFAETKLMAGEGTESDWYEMLSSSQRQAIRDAVVLRLAPTNPETFSPDQPIGLSVDLKNIDELVIRVYQINSTSYYRTHDEPLDTDIDLDGLVATSETKLKFSQRSVRRHRQELALDQISGRGVWVVDLIGKGVRARAMIRRGSINHVDTIVADGLQFTVFDENRDPIPQAAMWVGSREFLADDDGRIVIPPADRNRSRKVVITDNTLADSFTLVHREESYDLDAAIHIDQTLLQSGGNSTVLIRPRLSMMGMPVDPAMLTDVSVQIDSNDLDGIASSHHVDDLTPDQRDEWAIPIRVPPRLADLTVTVTGKIGLLSQGSEQTLSASRTWNIAGIRRTRQVHDAFLTRDNDAYVIEVRGRSGELVPSALVQLSLTTIYCDTPIEQTLASDDDGRVQLGPLTDVHKIGYSVAGGVQHEHRRDVDRFDWPTQIHIATGDTVRLPWPTTTAKSARDRFRLIATRDNKIQSDDSDRMTIQDGFLRIADLSAGDYRLVNRNTGHAIEIAVVDGPVLGNVAIGHSRFRSKSPASALSIASVQRGADGLTVQLSGDIGLARIHVYAKRFYGPQSPAAALHLGMPPLTGRSIRWGRSGYVSDLRLGDEYQYVLRRRYAAKYDGVMLPQPGLILNPWETEQTTNTSQSASAGDAVPKSSIENPAARADASESLDRQSADPTGSDFDFLADAGMMVANLQADQDGKLIIPDEVIAGMPIVQIVVCDPATVVQKTITSPLQDAETRDLRLAKTLDTEQPFSMLRSVMIATPDRPLDLNSLGSAQLQVVSSVASLFQTYQTLVDDDRLKEFAVLADWGSLDDEQKRAAYSRLACHELHLFLWSHDRKFFDDVIAPFLANKKEKQFVDDWLLGNDLSDYTRLWRYNRLNAAERALLAMRLPEVRTMIQRELREVVAQQDIDYETIRAGVEVVLRGKMMNITAQEFAFGGKAALRDSVGLHDQPAPSAEIWSALSMQRKAGRADAPSVATSMFQRRRLERQPAFYRDLDSTRQWAESHWDHVRSMNPTTPQSLIKTNDFWAALSNQSDDQISVSSGLLRPTDSRHAALVAMAFSGLPLTADDVSWPTDSNTPFKPSHAVAVVTKQLKSLRVGDPTGGILIGNQFSFADGSDPKEIQEFVAGVAYRGQIVLSNPSSRLQTVNVLWQLPLGSLPVTGSQTLDSRMVTLKPFAVTSIAYEFYFPHAGTFHHYPATVADGETLIARAQPQTFQVLAEPTDADASQWESIARKGDATQIADFLASANLREIDWMLVAHRMHDPNVYQTIVAVLKSNHLAIDPLWAYSLKHQDDASIETFLSLNPTLVQSAGPALRSELLRIDPVESQTIEMLEYAPLVRARAHRLGDADEILNPTFLGHYKLFLRTLAFTPSIDSQQRLTLAHYLLIQNRIRESIAAFNQIDRDDVVTQLQYDYIDAYLAMHQGDHSRAAKIAKSFIDHPVARWQSRFAELQSQLDQIRDLAGREQMASSDDPTAPESAIDPESGDLAMIDRERQQSAASQDQPEVIVRVEGDRLRIDHRRTRTATLNLYGVDLELLFSKAPFVREDLSRMAMVQPLVSKPLQFEDMNGVGDFDLGDDLRSQTLLVEVVCGASRSTALSYGGKLTTYVSEAFGQLQATDADTRAPIASAYVKVYAKYPDGSVRFYKDGYTDARGRFDYATVSAGDAKGSTRLAILVLSNQQGATLHDVASPNR
ncbi:hypothetical protein K227x_00460 [Rubripirellula lacrimiformis]|uniref:Uncharacterized protein n=1 Tax=Rubripirellula lacrimiformis TaxID=1930273 RepID=A0A517N3G5_9BACT|nr:hypothetical protein [Rubripirellula lacrimiformis]QDT01679.1 hypothetical protein K227x_00460 [Rubripirellula lacrimiformis]